MPLSVRPAPHRDAHLFLLVLEGERTGEEYRYFEALSSEGILDARRIEMELLPTPSANHASSPQGVLDRAIEAARGRKLTKVWLIFDVDTWGEKMLSEVSTEALKKDFGLAVSNPCFEIWLLVHFVSQDDLEAVLEDLKGVEPRKRSQKTKTQLRSARTCTEENPRNLTPAMLQQARRLVRQRVNAKTNTRCRWPEFPGTFVSRLVDEFDERGVLRRG